MSKLKLSLNGTTYSGTYHITGESMGIAGNALQVSIDEKEQTLTFETPREYQRYQDGVLMCRAINTATGQTCYITRFGAKKKPKTISL